MPGPWTEGVAERVAAGAAKAKAEDGVRVYGAQRQGAGSDDGEVSDDDSDDESGSEDEGMEGVEEEAPVASGSGARKKEEPVIDEDGFQMVPKKGRR